MDADAGGPPAADEQAVRRAVRQLHGAMVAARLDVLNGLLDPQYTLTHITGYRQPKREWLDVIQSGAFRYHDIQEEAVTVAVDGHAATVTGRGVFTATIQGVRRPWRLAFTLRYANQNGRWIAQDAHYTTW